MTDLSAGPGVWAHKVNEPDTIGQYPGPETIRQKRITGLRREVDGLPHSATARAKEIRAELSCVRNEQPKGGDAATCAHGTDDGHCLFDERKWSGAVNPKRCAGCPSTALNAAKAALDAAANWFTPPNDTGRFPIKEIADAVEKIEAALAPSPSPLPEPQDAREALQAEIEKWETDDRVLYPDNEVLDSLDRIRAALAQSDAQPGNVSELGELRLIAEENADNVRLLDYISDKIGLPENEELSQENFAHWLNQQSDAQPEALDAAIDFIADEYRTRDYEDQGEWLPPEARAIHAKLIELRYGHTAPPRPDASGLIEAAEHCAQQVKYNRLIAERTVNDYIKTKSRGSAEAYAEMEQWLRSRAADRSAK